MEKVSFAARKGDVVYYSLKDPLALDDRMLEGLGWPEDAKGLVFDFAPFSPADGYLDPPVSDKYCVTVMYRAEREEILVPAGFAAPEAFKLAAPSDFEAFRKLADFVLERDYILPIRRWLSDDYLKMCHDFSAHTMQKCDNRLLTLEGRPAGMASAMPAKFGGKPGMLLAQLWIDPALPEKTRADAAHIMAAWLRENERGAVSTGEHAKSPGTQKFFCSLGFKAVRYSVEKLKSEFHC